MRQTKLNCMTIAVLTSFIFKRPPLAKLWRKLELATKREIAKRAEEIKTSDDFLKVLAEVETGQVSLFE